MVAMTDFSRILVIAGAFSQTAFVLLYGFGTRWWNDPVGRALMIKSTGLALSLLLISVFYLLGDYPGREVVTTSAFALIVLGSYWQLIVFIRIRWRQRKSTDA